MIAKLTIAIESGSNNDDASRQQMRVKAQCLERHQNIAEHEA